MRYPLVSHRLQGLRMHRTLLPLALAVLTCAPLIQADEPITVGPADWPRWGGPTRDGVAAPGQQPPTKGGDRENVLWKAPVPGRGHGSPTVVGDQGFLATAETDRQTQSVPSLDRQTGKKLWQTDVHTGGLQTDKNQKSSLASCSIACDGKRLFVSFLNN